MAEAHPDITRPDVDLIAVRHWDVTTPAEQRAIADSVMESWAPWPPGLLAVSCFASTDRVTDVGLLRGTRTDPWTARRLRVLTYEQWSDERAYHRVTRTHPAPVEYRLHRSHRNTVSQVTGCVVVVTIEFDGPDPGRQRRWIDSVLDALEAEPVPIPGLAAAHFHTSTDGTQVLNCAEWTSEQAYDEALDRGPDGVGQTDLPEWRRNREFPGVTNNTAARYTPTGPAALSPAETEDPMEGPAVDLSSGIRS